jgi:hypothetical protein
MLRSGELEVKTKSNQDAECDMDRIIAPAMQD